MSDVWHAVGAGVVIRSDDSSAIPRGERKEI